MIDHASVWCLSSCSHLTTLLVKDMSPLQFLNAAFLKQFAVWGHHTCRKHNFCQKSGHSGIIQSVIRWRVCRCCCCLNLVPSSLLSPNSMAQQPLYIVCLQSAVWADHPEIYIYLIYRQPGVAIKPSSDCSHPASVSFH